MIPNALAALTLLVGVPLNAFVTWKLWRLTRSSLNPVLRERGIVATFVLILVVVYGLLFVNNDLPVPFLTFEDTKILSRGAMLAVAIVPALYWLQLYRRRA